MPGKGLRLPHARSPCDDPGDEEHPEAVEVGNSIVSIPVGKEV